MKSGGGLALGAGIGLVFGAALGDAGLGLIFGAAIGLVLGTEAAAYSKNGTQQE